MTDKELLERAYNAAQNSYSPYSKFSVGAALITTNGNVYTGVNIENASYSATVCAERTAFFSAVANAEKSFEAIAIASGDKTLCPPCGICRQVMREFCDDNFRIILCRDNEIKSYKLCELMPLAFELK